MTFKQACIDEPVDSRRKSVEVEELLQRLECLCPVEMAQALYTLEFHKKFSAIFRLSMPSQESDSTLLMFSRGLKHEMENIYLELSRHLQEKSGGSIDLMNCVFEFFNRTMRSLVKVPHLVNLN